MTLHLLWAQLVPSLMASTSAVYEVGATPLHPTPSSGHMGKAWSLRHHLGERDRQGARGKMKEPSSTQRCVEPPQGPGPRYCEPNKKAVSEPLVWVLCYTAIQITKRSLKNEIQRVATAQLQVLQPLPVNSDLTIILQSSARSCPAHPCKPSSASCLPTFSGLPGLPD